MKYKHLTMEEREEIQPGLWAKESESYVANDANTSDFHQAILPFTLKT